jgi:tetratricopeptide (TPR) repeat protein
MMKRKNGQSRKTKSPTTQSKPDYIEVTESAATLTEGRALFCIIAATVLVYANSLNGAFVFDDLKQIVGNPQLHSLGNIFHAFTSDVWDFQRATLTRDIPPPYYRPLFTAYLTINYQLFGLWEPGWHLMNLFTHVLATVAVYFLIKKLSGDRLIATLTSLLFGLHPAHVESVSWISGIPDPLSALFYVPSFLLYVWYRETGERKYLAASLAAYFLSALCKETPLCLPLALFIWELSHYEVKQGWDRRLKDLSFRMIPYALTAILYLGLRYSVLGRISWKHPFMAHTPDSAIWMTVPFVLLNYLFHLVAPFYLSLIYGTSFVNGASDPRFLVALVILIGIGSILWIYRARLSKQVWVALGLIISPLLPVLNLKVFHFEYIIQDRYLYLPSIGFCYLVAILIQKLWQKQHIFGITVTAVVLIAFGASTIMQNRVWRDSAALWQRAIFYAPTSWSSHYNLGRAYLELGQDQAAKNQLLEAQRLNPREANVLNNLALAKANLGDRTGAVSDLRAALLVDPTLLEAHNNLGAFLYEQGSFADAQHEFSIVLATDPSSTSARFNMARTLAAAGNYEAAIREFESVLTIDPEDVPARYELAMTYASSGHQQEAIGEFNRATQLDRNPNRQSDMKKKLDQLTKGNHP